MNKEGPVLGDAVNVIAQGLGWDVYAWGSRQGLCPAYQRIHYEGAMRWAQGSARGGDV